MTRRKAAPPPGVGRPNPPPGLVDELLDLRFAPAPDLARWAFETFIDAGSALENPDHAHLRDADIAFAWASTGFSSKGKRVVALCEDIRQAGQGNAFRRGRHAQQLREWFGREPDFLITVDAFHAAEIDDAGFCALIEHELYHVAQVKDHGDPVFAKDGRPKLHVVAHDVEEFVGVVERYGVADPESYLGRMIMAAARGPTVGPARVAAACGTCALRLAA